MEEIHEIRNTMVIDYYSPSHKHREKPSQLFLHTKEKLLEITDRCYICNRTAEQVGEPLEANHFPIEWSLAEMMDWSEGSQIRKYAPHFDWANFSEDDPYKFVDDMTVNGMILCKLHHTGKDAGYHNLPYAIWIAQKYGKVGYQFTPTQILIQGN
jgi:hypothetical protein